MADQVNLRGEGSVVWTFDLPLSAVTAEQVNQGKLIPDDEDSTLALGPIIPSADSSEESEDEQFSDEEINHDAEAAIQADVEANLAEAQTE